MKPSYLKASLLLCAALGAVGADATASVIDNTATGAPPAALTFQSCIRLPSSIDTNATHCPSGLHAGAYSSGVKLAGVNRCGVPFVAFCT